MIIVLTDLDGQASYFRDSQLRGSSSGALGWVVLLVLHSRRRVLLAGHNSENIRRRIRTIMFKHTGGIELRVGGRSERLGVVECFF